MRYRFIFMGIVVGLLVFSTQLITGQEQEIDQNLSYAEVVGRIFDSNNSDPHQWQFTGNDQTAGRYVHDDFPSG